MSKRIIVTLIAIVMAVLFAGAAVYADSGDPGLSLGADVLQKGAGMEKQEGTNKPVSIMQKLYYGTDKTDAGIAWYVIAYDGCYGDGGEISFVDFQINYLYPDDSVTLLRCGASESAEFSRNVSEMYANAYGWLDSESGDPQIPSYLRSYLESRYLSGWNDNGKARKPYISSKEQSAVLPRDLDGYSDDYSTENYRSNRIKGKIVKDALLWPLSVAEAEKLPETARVTGEDVDWWLRSPGEFGRGSDGLLYHKAAYVNGYGVISYKGEMTDYDYKVRPAFNLNRKTVALTSAASGGKTSGETGKDALTAVGTNSSEEWKVTLLDDDHKDFDVVKNETTYDSKTGTMTVTYTGAMTGENEYISAVIVRDGAVRYYGRIKALKSDSDKSGTAEISLKGKMDRKNGDKLYVFNEQYNGDKTGSSAAMTDFTSALKEVRAYIEPYAIVMGADVLGNSYNTSDAQIVYYGRDSESTAYPWRVIGCENYNGSVASSVGNMTLFADQDMAFTMFNPTNNRTNIYEGSLLRKSVDTISETISDEEKNAVVKRTLKHGKYSTKDDTDCIAGDYDLDDQILWPLSTKEAFSTDSDLRVDAAEESWWLRSPGNDERYAAFVSKFGDVFPVGNGVDVERAVRPAFSLNIDSVLFASAAENGKKSGGEKADGTGADALTGVGKNESGEWKVTLLDDGSEKSVGNGHKGFDVRTSGIADKNGVLSVRYSGAAAGDNEYVSAVIVNGDVVKYYGRIKAVTEDKEKSGTVDISVKDKLDVSAGDRLYVFSEQYNGDKEESRAAMTDLSSALKMVPIMEVSWEGSGTEEDPFIIADEQGWNDLAEHVEAGFDTQSEYFRLDIDIKVSTMIGTADMPFRGVFDGNGHSIDVNIKTSTAAAPFYMIKGADSAEESDKTAEIRNLIVKGSISGGQHSAGLVMYADGYCNISCCVVDADITAPGNLGGFIGHGGKSALKLSMCVFSGSLTGAGESPAEAGGLWGWSDSGAKPTVINCMEAGRKYTNVKLNPIGRGEPHSGDDLKVENCFYMTAPIGDPTSRNWEKYGSQVYKAAVDNTVTTGLEDPIGENELVGITAYKGGIGFNGAVYTEKGSVIYVTLPSICDDCKVSPDTVMLEGSRPNYKITMPDCEVAVTYEEGVHHNWEFKGLQWIGDEASGYTAASAEYVCKNDASHNKSVQAALASKEIQPTCTAGGETTYTASVAAADSPDGTARKESKDAKVAQPLGHKWKFISFRWSGNEKDGYAKPVAEYVCEHDESHTVSVKADLDAQVTKPTCTVEGKTTYTASIDASESMDGAAHSESKDAKATEALGHKWAFDGFTWTGSAETGYTAAAADYVCMRDGSHKDTREAALTSEVTKPTCTGGGKTTYKALIDADTSLDGKEHSEQKEALLTDPAGHDWGDWDIILAPTCISQGFGMRICKSDPVHQDFQIIPVDPEAHDFGEWKFVTEPETNKTGSRKRVCTRDASHTETERFPASSRLLAAMESSGKTALKISWNSVDGAEGYEVWLVKCSHKSKKNYCSRVSTIAAGGKLNYTKKKLKKKTAYKAFVAAYKTVDGQIVYTDTSLTVHAYTSGGDKKYTNPNEVTVKKSKYTLAAGKTAKIKASVTGKDAKKILIPTSHCAKVRYMTTDPAVATVSRKGRIKAKAAGSCRICVIAASGIRKSVRVKVK